MPITAESHGNYDDFHEKLQFLKDLADGEHITLEKEGSHYKPIKGTLNFLERARNFLVYNPKESQFANAVVFFIDFLNKNRQHIEALSPEDVQILWKVKHRIAKKSQALKRCIENVLVASSSHTRQLTKQQVEKQEKIQEDVEASQAIADALIPTNPLGTPLIHEDRTKDVVFQCKDGEQIKVHSQILRADPHSYFSKVLSPERSAYDLEARKQALREETVAYPAASVAAFVNLLYQAGDVSDYARPIQTDLLALAKKFGLSLLENQCQEALAEPVIIPNIENRDTSFLCKDGKLAHINGDYLRVYKKSVFGKALQTNAQLEIQKKALKERTKDYPQANILLFVNILARTKEIEVTDNVSDAYILQLFDVLKLAKDFELPHLQIQCKEAIKKSLGIKGYSPEAVDAFLHLLFRAAKISDYERSIQQELVQIAEKFGLSDLKKQCQNVGLLLSQDPHKDVTFTCQDGRQIEAHSQILGTYQGAQFGQNELEITKHYSFESVDAFVNILYGTAVPSNFNLSIQLDLFMLADQFSLKDLKDQCQKALLMKMGQHPLHVADAWVAFDKINSDLTESQARSNLQDILIQGFNQHSISSYLGLSKKTQESMATIFIKHQGNNDNIKCLVGICELYGIGIEKKKSLDIFKELAKRGNEPSQRILRDCITNVETSLEILQFAINNDLQDLKKQCLEALVQYIKPTTMDKAYEAFAKIEEFGSKDLRGKCKQALLQKIAQSPNGTLEAWKTFDQGVGKDRPFNSAFQNILIEAFYNRHQRCYLKFPKEQQEEIFKIFENHQKNNDNIKHLVGVCYLYGIGVKQNKKEGLEILKALAQKDNGWAQCALGCYLTNEEAIRYLERAQANKIGPASAALGIKLQNKKDYTNALTAFVGVENASAKFGLGQMYEHGLGGVQKDTKMAYQMYKESADLGNEMGQYYLGECYEFGWGGGIQKNEELAIHYYRMAAQQGYQEAKDKLKKLKVKEVDVGSHETQTTFSALELQLISEKENLEKVKADHRLVINERQKHLDEIQIRAASYTTTVSEQPKQIGDVLSRSDLTKDVTFTCQDGQVKAHSQLLRAYKDSYFSARADYKSKAPITNVMSDVSAGNDSSDNIDITKNFPAKSVEALVSILYGTANLSEFDLSIKFDLYMLADQFCLLDLRDKCKQSFLPQKTPDEILNVLDEFSLMIERGQLEEMGRRFPSVVAEFEKTLLKAFNKSSEASYKQLHKKSLEKLFHTCQKYQETNETMKYVLGYCYFFGVGVDQNRTEGLKIFKELEGNEWAQARVGIELLTEVEQAKTMIAEFQKFANKYSSAPNVLEEHSSKIAEVNRYFGKDSISAPIIYSFAEEHFSNNNYASAVMLYKKLAELGHAASKADLGVCYEKGYGVNIDLEAAFKLYQQSAELGNSFGLYCLADCYEKGIGVAKNLELAIKYYKEAASKGHEASKAALTRLQIPM